MPVKKVTQLNVSVVEYPYMDKEFPVSPASPLVIESAIYYDPADRSVVLDVEPFLSPLLVNNRLAFVVENDAFGGNRHDPAPGVVKELKLVYRYNGISSTLVCREKSTVVLHAY